MNGQFVLPGTAPMRKVASLARDPQQATQYDATYRITAVGHERSEPGNYRWDGLQRGDRPYAVLQLTLHGCGRYDTPTQRYLIPPHHLMIARIPGDHRYHLPKHETWRHYFICLTGDGALSTLDKLLPTTGPVMDLSTEPKLRQSIEQIVIDGLGGFSDSYAMSASLYQLLMDLCRFSDGTQLSQATDPIARAMSWAREHWQEDINVSDLAAASGLSKWHFSRAFRQYNDTSPAAWLSELRLRHAARALVDERQTIAEIGRSCGYKDPSHFGKAFKQAFGMTPLEFRTTGWFMGIE